MWGTLASGKHNSCQEKAYLFENKPLYVCYLRFLCYLCPVLLIDMVKKRLFPDYLFESSWEVCNKVGGIYTVLSTRAKTLQERLKDHLIFIGPDCWQEVQCPYFTEDFTLFSDWKKQLPKDLKIKIGRWNIPGNPIAILVDFTVFYEMKDQIYTEMWQQYGVDGLHAYGDYDEASMFSYAAAKIVENFYHYYIKAGQRVVYQGNEWMTCLGLLYLRTHLPQVATVFTTHATSIGRSIAGNNKPLYEYLYAYNGNQMAEELNMQSKHSVERQAAHAVDCFTTVSDITARECKELLDKDADVVLPNGFEDDFVPKGAAFTTQRKKARACLLQLANALTGKHFDDDTLIVSTSGRYEFRNKGIDVFIEAMNRLRCDASFTRNLVAFIEVPAWVSAPRQDLIERLSSNQTYDTPLEQPCITHWLHQMESDNVLNMFRHLGIENRLEENVSVVFIPSYLNGDDGVVNMAYYDLVAGNDLCVYPSYYEPWGYTPLEAVAFKVPCITTDLAGFGLWVKGLHGFDNTIEEGVKVIARTDYNYWEVAEGIKQTVETYAAFDADTVKNARANAAKIAKKALWNRFIAYYEDAYEAALKKAEKRNQIKNQQNIEFYENQSGLCQYSSVEGSYDQVKAS